MRTVIPFNKKWAFSKEADSVPAAMPDRWIWVNLPHTWNSIDGQDGGGDYYRGTCWYAHELALAELPQGKDMEYYLEFRGANSSADLYVNGKRLAHHDGGYSTWRANITGALQENNLIAVAVDNSPSQQVYPQMADFTFYGGLYREVSLIAVPRRHFDLDYCGSNGLMITPTVTGADAQVEVRAYTNCRESDLLVAFTLFDREGRLLERKTAPAGMADVEFTLDNVHLWNGRKDPYLYSATAELLDGDTVLDSISSRFGCRSFEIDPEKGFLLNGESYPLRGVARHQDRLGIGNALLPEHHREDMDLICELGATTIRLAHYQHDQYFYDLCDERGMVVWAEIPYISSHMPGGRENTVSQMKELITQNYNHPSIVVWGLSNEITMQGAEDPDLLENHRILNDLCHQMDKTRLTTLACISMCPTDAAIVDIPDVLSYNHYFGWYGGTMDMNGPWFDKFHAEHPDRPIGCSEYGCEALNWHTSDPRQGDYTEEYQALYHEELIKQLFTRPYLWATHVWNMFDFGADNRAEGGENGQNHKGLVTFDRKYKKDAFYAYKAWLSDEPFVHICGKRYVDRVENVTTVTVYSNQPAVELFANGKSLGRQESEYHFFRFDVPNAGETSLTAKAGDCKDYSSIRKVDAFNEDYRFHEKGAVLNWFDVTEPEGRLSLNSTLGEIKATKQGLALVEELMKGLSSGGQQNEKSMGFEMPEEDRMKMLNGFTLLRMVSMGGAGLSKEQLLELNAKLNAIEKQPKE